MNTVTSVSEFTPNVQDISATQFFQTYITQLALQVSPYSWTPT